MNLKLKVAGMKCCGCENRIKNALLTVDGVKEVNANHETGIVNITCNQNINIDTIKEKLNALDFPVTDEEL